MVVLLSPVCPTPIIPRPPEPTHEAAALMPATTICEAADIISATGIFGSFFVWYAFTTRDVTSVPLSRKSAASRPG